VRVGERSRVALRPRERERDGDRERAAAISLIDAVGLVVSGGCCRQEYNVAQDMTLVACLDASKLLELPVPSSTLGELKVSVLFTAREHSPIRVVQTPRQLEIPRWLHVKECT
jgi:hypothetical protein